MKFATMIGEIRIAGELRNWNLACTKESPEPGVELVHFAFRAPELSDPPNVRLEWRVPQLDMQFRWHTDATFQRNIPPDWGAPLESSLAYQVPAVQLGALDGENRLTFALSEALRTVKIKAGVCEEANEIACSIELFSVPEAPLSSYETVLRLDTRHLFYAEVLRQTFRWYETFPECTPAVVPAAAFDPVYSSWYSFHQNLFDRELEAECRLAAACGMKGIIVDDGWQTDDCNRGYAYCGDWEISKNRFPDMRAHVAKVHELGMKYLVWYSVPFIGVESENYARFKDMLLDASGDRHTYFALDPRYKEVRDFLTETYVNAVRNWDLDGLKLDFIDAFTLGGKSLEDDAGRDFVSLEEAIDALMSGITEKLTAVKPDIMIEFRQSYIGPAIRKYGNMMRVGDWVVVKDKDINGIVIEITLTTVKVQNWDYTISTIQPQALINGSFVNWRNMFDSGGRRIARTINIDLRTVHFMADDEVARWENDPLLAEYIADMRKRMAEARDKGDEVTARSLRLTNLGLFRIYLQNYVSSLSSFNGSFISMVRLMEPTENGVPMQIYFFTAQTSWVEYEREQSALFEHIFSIVPEFDLRLFQAPTGDDIRACIRS